MNPINWLRSLFGERTWSAAWVRDKDGEVHHADYRRIGSVYVIKVVAADGRMLQGYSDGTTSMQQFPAWWPGVIPFEMATRVQSQVPQVDITYDDLFG